MKPHPEPVEIRLTAPWKPTSRVQLQRLAAQALAGWSVPADAERLTGLALKQLPFGSLVSSMASNSRVKLPEPLDVEQFVDQPAASKVFRFRTNRDLRAHISRLNAAIYYTQAVADGDSAPTAAVGRQMALDPIQARNIVTLARLNDYLSKAQQGLAGGELTPTARDLHRRLKDYLEGQK